MSAIRLSGLMAVRVAATIAISLSSLSAASAWAGASTQADSGYASPGSVEAWKRAKFPWMYPATSGQVLNSAEPLSQQEIWLRAKFPWRYPTNTSPTTSVHSPEPLSQQEIWQRAKFPWKYNTDRSVRQ